MSPATSKATKKARPAATASPAAGEITLADAAARLHMTGQGIGQWTARPGAPIRKDGQRVFVQWPAFMRWREQELVRVAVNNANPGDIETARARKASADAELAEIEVAKARGHVVAVADYEEALGRILDREMARLRALPVRLAHLGTAVEDAAEKEVEQIIVEMSQYDADVIDEPMESAKAAA
jgi:hypothetical protein